MELGRTRIAKIWKSISNYGLVAGLQDAAARWARAKLSVPFDVLGDYDWILMSAREAVLPARNASPLRINWLLPPMAEGSGGHLNIFRTIYNLEQWGHENRIYIVGRDAVVDTDVREILRNFYFPIKAPIEAFAGIVTDSDALVATHWTTAYAARGVANTAGKFYFVQDLEDRFYAEGSFSEFVRETYRFGFYGITLGRWIADVLNKEFEMMCEPFGFSYDREIYSLKEFSRPLRKTKRVLFYARPQTERRGFELGLLALSLVASEQPDIEFVLVGFQPRRMRIPFRAAMPGILRPVELAELYRNCDVALVLSHTNLSMLPLELMACGCGVVSNRGRNVEWLLTEETAQLADPNPGALATAVLALLRDEELRARQTAAGLGFAERTEWIAEIKRIESAFYRGLKILQVERGRA